ncbi:MAG: hypothetical protein ACLR8Y_01130 [Alistipes indistinctus]
MKIKRKYGLSSPKISSRCAVLRSEMAVAAYLFVIGVLARHHVFPIAANNCWPDRSYCC